MSLVSGYFIELQTAAPVVRYATYVRIAVLQNSLVSAATNIQCSAATYVHKFVEIVFNTKFRGIVVLLSINLNKRFLTSSAYSGEGGKEYKLKACNPRIL